MVRLKRFEFTCSSCGENKVTFITEEKFEEIRQREREIANIFPPEFFPNSYHNIFTTRYMCSKCIAEKFGGNSDELFDVNENENTDELESRISEMYENAR